MVERICPAEPEQLEPVQRCVEEQIERYDCSARVRFQLDVAVEEIFINIAKYAYRPGQAGQAAVRCCVGGDPLQVTIQFQDQGVPFNPLAKEDADITLTAQERQIGGLGILMVKKSMDAVRYSYEDGKNILTIQKNIGAAPAGAAGEDKK